MGVGSPKRGGFGHFVDLRGALARKSGDLEGGRLIPNAHYALCLHILFKHFSIFFLSTKISFSLFYFLFVINIKYSQQNIDHSKTRIGDQKLSVELYV